MTIIDGARDVTRLARRELRATVRDFFPEPAPAPGAEFGQKLGMWLSIGAVVVGVGAAVIMAFTAD